MIVEKIKDFGGWILNKGKGLGEWFSEWSLKYIPDPYVIAIILTFVTFGSVLILETIIEKRPPVDGVRTAFDAWVDGVWTLLPFMATLSVLLMAGDAIAKSPSVTRILERIASIPSTQFSAVAFTAFISMATSLISWGLGLIVGATLAKRVAYETKKKGIQVHYPLLAAAGYTSLMMYGHGLTSSAALIMTDPTLIPATFPEYVRDGIPLTETIGHIGNIVGGILVLFFVPLVLGLMHPKANIVEIPDPVEEEIEQTLEEKPLDKPIVETPLPKKFRFWKGKKKTNLTFADTLNNSKIIGLIIAIFPGYYFFDAWVLQRGGLSNLTLNSINAFFLFFAIILWVKPLRIVDQMKDSVSNISGIIFQFPFYAGIAGLLTGTGLATVITEFTASFATPQTWPIIGILITGLVNIFIPSGGGQWVAQGPILLETTRELGMSPNTAVIIEMLGDQLTNMIQPFWAIPLLAIANLRARDIIGYTTIAMITGYIIVGTSLTIFL